MGVRLADIALVALTVALGVSAVSCGKPRSTANFDEASRSQIWDAIFEETRHPESTSFWVNNSTLQFLINNRDKEIYLDLLQSSLTHESYTVRLYALIALFMMRDEPGSRLDSLIRVLGAESQDERELASYLLKEYLISEYSPDKSTEAYAFETGYPPWDLDRETDEEFVPILLQHLRSADDVFTRETIVDCLRYFVQEPGVVGVLVVEAGSEEPQMREAVARTLATLSPGLRASQDSRLLEIVLRLTTDSDSSVRYQACKALMPIGRTDQSVKALTARASDADPSVRSSALEALGEVGRSDEAVAILIRGLDDDDPGVVDAALRGLWKIGPDAAAALPRLNEMLKANPRNTPLRQTICWTILQIE